MRVLRPAAHRAARLQRQPVHAPALRHRRRRCCETSNAACRCCTHAATRVGIISNLLMGAKAPQKPMRLSTSTITAAWPSESHHITPYEALRPEVHELHRGQNL
eukprot:6205914-Pleurochrysis_carterae.AAC.2